MLSARPPSAEVTLAVAVLQRAIDDATTPDNRLARPRVINTDAGPRHSFTVGLKPRDREEAVRFLLDMSPGWASSREAWCDAADIVPDLVQRHAIRQIPHSSIPADLRRALRLPTPAPAHDASSQPNAHALQGAPAMAEAA